MSFYVGQKVVCIMSWSPLCADTVPQKDKVYTIRELLDIGTEPSLRLVEIVNPPRLYLNVPDAIEPAWVRYAFRPLVERKTDISIFTKMLNKNKELT